MFARFVRQEEGLETVAYAIIAGLVVAGLVAIGAWVKTQFTSLETEVGAWLPLGGNPGAPSRASRGRLPSAYWSK